MVGLQNGELDGGQGEGVAEGGCVEGEKNPTAGRRGLGESVGEAGGRFLGEGGQGEAFVEVHAPRRAGGGDGEVGEGFGTEAGLRVERADAEGLVLKANGAAGGGG